MSKTWQVQRAKAEFSKLIDTSVTEGPQTITRHGRAVAVVIGADEFRRLRGRRSGFKVFLRSAPLHELELVRSRDRGRRVAL